MMEKKDVLKRKWLKSAYTAFRGHAIR